MLSEPVHNFKNTWCQKTRTFSAWHHKAASDCPVKDVGKRKYLGYMLTNNIQTHFKSPLQDVESWQGAILIAEPCFSWASPWEGVGPLLTRNGGLASLLSTTLTFPPLLIISFHIPWQTPNKLRLHHAVTQQSSACRRKARLHGQQIIHSLAVHVLRQDQPPVTAA